MKAPHCLEITVPCSDFGYVFLVKEARLFNQHMNGLLNAIVRDYFLGKLDQFKKSQPFSDNTSPSVVVHLYDSVLKLIPDQDTTKIKQEIQNAMYCYVASRLLVKSEETKKTREMQTEIWRYLDNRKDQTNLFDARVRI